MARRISKAKVSAEQILADHDPVVRGLAERLRALIRQAVPDATETANPGWRSLSYRHPVAGYFCGLFPLSDGVRLALEFGALLPDPDGLLTGDHMRQVRYVDVRSRRDIRVQPLKTLLRAAVDLPSRRDVRLALIRAGARPVSPGRKGRGGNQ